MNGMFEHFTFRTAFEGNAQRCKIKTTRRVDRKRINGEIIK